MNAMSSDLDRDDLTDAIEAAANALAAEFPKGALGLLTYGDIADVVVPAAAKVIVADTRRKVAEEIERDGIDRSLDCLCAHYHAAIARGGDGTEGR